MQKDKELEAYLAELEKIASKDMDEEAIKEAEKIAEELIAKISSKQKYFQRLL